MTRRRLQLAAAAALAAAAVPTAALAAGTVSLTPPGTASFGVTLDGNDAAGSYSVAIPVSYTSTASNKNATLGRHITATSTTFKGASTSKTLATAASTLTSFADSAG